MTIERIEKKYFTPGSHPAKKSSINGITTDLPTQEETAK
jgi:hypothetical protein